MMEQGPLGGAEAGPGAEARVGFGAGADGNGGG